jgi:hypothetical protein
MYQEHTQQDLNFGCTCICFADLLAADTWTEMAALCSRKTAKGARFCRSDSASNPPSFSQVQTGGHYLMCDGQYAP